MGSTGFRLDIQEINAESRMIGRRDAAQQSPAADALQPTLRSGFQALSRELLPAATRRENQELKTDAPSGPGLAAALGHAELRTHDECARHQVVHD